MEKQKSPELRFSQFKNDWYETTLGDVVDIVGGGTPDTNVPEFWNGDIDWYSPTEIGENVYANGSTKKITALGLKSSSAKILPAKKTVLFSSRAGIGDMAILDKPAATNQGFQSFIANNIDVYFLYSMGVKIKKFALSKASGSTFLEISRNQLAQMEFFAPSAELGEQTQIGNFFQNLDQSIALHEKKLSQTQNLKETMLEKMFPKAGSQQPEIRLKGFSGDWEQRKLGDISEIKTGPFGSTLHADDYVNNGTPIVTTEHFKSGELPEKKKGIPQVSESDFCRLNNYILKTDDIVFSRVGSVDINALVTPFQAGWLFSGRVLRVRSYDYVWSSFLHYELSTERAKNDVISRAVGQTMPSINTEILKRTKVYLPKSKVEQIQIGQFFKQLDETLVLQQQQLQTLKNLKQAFLEKMFV